VFRLKEFCLQENRAPGVAAAAILIGLLFIEGDAFVRQGMVSK